jgi:hypothetical protein
MANLEPQYLGRTTGYQRTLAAAGLTMLTAAGLAIAAAPSLMPESYSWVRQVVSDTASQGTEGAWLTRSAFVLSGVSVMMLAVISGPIWGTWARASHALYGVLVLGLASFSRRAWTGSSFDAFEDLVHSGLAIVAGVVFTVAVVLVAVKRRRPSGMTRLRDWTTVTVMALLPLVMLSVLDVAGLAQRVMVVVGFLWYGTEATRLMRSTTPIASHVRAME